MAASWQFRGELLVVTEEGVTSNDELEHVLVREALCDPRAKPGLCVLWDSRLSITPISADDVAWRTSWLATLAEQGRLARLALLLGPGQSLTAAAARQTGSQVPGLAFAVFDDESDASAWLAGG